MLVDIFSCFDDKNEVFMSLYLLMWALPLAVLVVFISNYWVMNPGWMLLLGGLKQTVFSQVGRSSGMGLDGFVSLMAVHITGIIFMNLSGMIPYVFGVSSHLLLSFSLSFPVWLSLILSALVLNWSSVVAALLPAGAPPALSPFLVLVETVSLLFRPITLSVRLAANMSAGHIVLGLIGNYFAGACFSSSSALILALVQVFYFIFEFAVCAVQGYIFCLLLVLYSDEHSRSWSS